MKLNPKWITNDGYTYWKPRKNGASEIEYKGKKIRVTGIGIVGELYEVKYVKIKRI